jgi:hypothetical protein
MPGNGIHIEEQRHVPAAGATGGLSTSAVCGAKVRKVIVFARPLLEHVRYRKGRRSEVRTAVPGWHSGPRLPAPARGLGIIGSSHKLDNPRPAPSGRLRIAQGQALVVLRKLRSSSRVGAEEPPARGKVVRSLQVDPNRLRAGRVTPFSVRATAQLRHQSDHLAQARRHIGPVGPLDDFPDRFVLGRLEHGLATDFGTAPIQAAHVQRSPGHDQAYGQARQ